MVLTGLLACSIRVHGCRLEVHVKDEASEAGENGNITNISQGSVIPKPISLKQEFCPIGCTCKPGNGDAGPGPAWFVGYHFHPDRYGRDEKGGAETKTSHQSAFSKLSLATGSALIATPRSARAEIRPVHPIKNARRCAHIGTRGVFWLLIRFFLSLSLFKNEMYREL